MITKQLTFEEWLKKVEYAPSYEEYKEFLLKVGFSRRTISRMWRDVNRQYQTYLLTGEVEQ